MAMEDSDFDPTNTGDDEGIEREMSDASEGSTLGLTAVAGAAGGAESVETGRSEKYYTAWIDRNGLHFQGDVYRVNSGERVLAEIMLATPPDQSISQSSLLERLQERYPEATESDLSGLIWDLNRVGRRLIVEDPEQEGEPHYRVDERHVMPLAQGTEGITPQQAVLYKNALVIGEKRRAFNEAERRVVEALAEEGEGDVSVEDLLKAAYPDATEVERSDRLPSLRRFLAQLARAGYTLGAQRSQRTPKGPHLPTAYRRITTKLGKPAITAQPTEAPDEE